MKKFKFWIGSSRNITFKYEETFDLDDLGFDLEEWEKLSESEKAEILDDYGTQLTTGYVDWSVTEMPDE